MDYTSHTISHFVLAAWYETLFMAKILQGLESSVVEIVALELIVTYISRTGFCVYYLTGNKCFEGVAKA